MTQSEVTTVKLSDIRENPVALRTIDHESEGFIGLRDSIRVRSILNAISVRKKTEDVDGKVITFYEIVDGLHRYSAAVELGLKRIPAIIVKLTDTQVQEAQIMANVHKIETRPVEYTRQLNRLLAANPTMTVADLAARLAKSASWVSQRLGLLKLGDKVAELVDAGKIKISNAVALAKLPQEEQPNYVDAAMTQGAEEFAPTVQARVKELRDAKREGREADGPKFSPIARLQKISNLKSELEKSVIGPELIKRNKVKTPQDGFALGVAWALHLDPDSIEMQRAKAEAKSKAAEEMKKKRTVERTAKKAEEAQQAAAEAAAAVSA